MSAKNTVNMILAVDRGNAIGWSDGRLPWKLPGDMQRFKELTTGHDVIMGRKTFESFKRPQGLPNRFNIVVTSDLNGYHEDICPVNNFENMVLSFMDSCDGELWIIGGASIYDQAIDLQLVDRIYLTLVDTNSGADVTLQHDLVNWKIFVLNQLKIGIEWSLEYISAPQTDSGISYTFLTLKRTFT